MRKFIFISILILNSCGIAQKSKIIGNYYLVAGDTHEMMTLSYHSPDWSAYSYGTIIQYCVFAVGYNEKYIIVKQHPYNFMASNSLDKTITNYYIVPIEDTYIPNKTPLSEFQFDQKRKLLGIENIEFTVVYKDLE